ncbi:aminopeptidase N, partial [Alteromonas sp. 14N.309.X.WAT.G.H12]
MSVNIKRRLDYKKPAFTITHVCMHVCLHPTQTQVKCTTSVTRIGDHDAPLSLDGEQLSLVGVRINGEPYQDYEKTEGGLVLNNVPDTFELEIETHIDPENNHALEGLYLSNGVYCTQCEAEGFRRITYFLDRPDVLATYEVTVLGDKASCPTLLSNGNPVDAGENEDGTHWVS